MSVNDYLIFYYSTTLLNIASCQIRQPNRKKPASYIHDTSSTSSIQSLNPLPCSSSFHSLLMKTPQELCDVVIQLLPNDPIPYIRKAQIMNLLKW